MKATIRNPRKLDKILQQISSLNSRRSENFMNILDRDICERIIKDMELCSGEIVGIAGSGSELYYPVISRYFADNSETKKSIGNPKQIIYMPPRPNGKVIDRNYRIFIVQDYPYHKRIGDKNFSLNTMEELEVANA